MIGYLATDEDNSTYLYSNKPIRQGEYFYYTGEDDSSCWRVKQEAFPNINFPKPEDEPIKVEIKLNISNMTENNVVIADIPKVSINDYSKPSPNIINIPTEKVIKLTQADRFIEGLKMLCDACEMVSRNNGEYIFNDETVIQNYVISAVLDDKVKQIKNEENE